MTPTSLLTIMLLGITLCNGQETKALANTRLCRYHYGLSRCTETPLQLRGENRMWCPYHICGASFIPAKRCPQRIEDRATHRCSVTRVHTPMYKCLNLHRHRIVKLPLYCKGDECKTEVRVCACRRKSPQRKLYYAKRKLGRYRCRSTTSAPSTTRRTTTPSLTTGYPSGR